ncbi:sialate O-acetylesterase [Chitinophaga rhizophila]|uniref:Sialate O-acetylesterase n=1 Tax=Chitinophaga rhizophila TaxID=2866212 RepID=A0ABS7GI76_9BACT|nr:sialate O-acetylesterase [Chitinophaga rhizophila]MBW8687401.1 sialate O-acetylesterase [Chitinophaga rhizophila]
MNRLFTMLSLLAAPLALHATVKPHSLFTHHMVLQQGMPVPVWGEAATGEKVTVSFNGQQVSTVARDGKWIVKLSPLPYITKPATLTISGENTVTIKDVLVGEVWICSGQSNMERQLGPRPPQPPVTDWEKERDQANFPLVREYYVPLKYSATPLDDVNQQWQVCSPQTVSDFSAVGYFFTSELYKKLKVPVGFIFTAYGGTPAEDWTSAEAMTSNPALTDFVQHYDQIKYSYVPAGKLKNGLYNGMIHPLLPYAVKGVAWYQGEANAEHPAIYPELLSNMIRNWRTDFARPDLPFLIVQIAPFQHMPPEIREAQLKVVQKVPHTALIVTTDCGDANDIHPSNKRPVGERLAIAAAGMVYKQPGEYAGPMYKGFAIKGNQVVLQFTHTGKGLKTKDDAPLKGFTIAGADKQFQPATAVIKGNTVIVSAAGIKKPVAVRYGWSNVPDVNLYNSADLPASPFRTDMADK